MNNPKSMVLGWVSLIGVAGVSFYFAKQSINERRRQQDITGRQKIASDEAKTPQGPNKRQNG